MSRATVPTGGLCACATLSLVRYVESAPGGVPEIELFAGTIAYDDTGGDGRVLVLPHGLTIGSPVWRKAVAGLAGDSGVFCPRQPLGAHRGAMRETPIGTAFVNPKVI